MFLNYFTKGCVRLSEPSKCKRGCGLWHNWSPVVEYIMKPLMVDYPEPGIATGGFYLNISWLTLDYSST